MIGVRNLWEWFLESTSTWKQQPSRGQSIVSWMVNLWTLQKIPNLRQFRYVYLWPSTNLHDFPSSNSYLVPPCVAEPKNQSQVPQVCQWLGCIAGGANCWQGPWFVYHLQASFIAYWATLDQKRCGDISLWISDYIHLNPNQEPFQSTKINDPTLSNIFQLWLWHLGQKFMWSPTRKIIHKAIGFQAVCGSGLVQWGGFATSTKTAQERTWPDCSHWTAGATAVCVCCVV